MKQKRIIHYYELDFKFIEGFQFAAGDEFRSLLKMIDNLAINRDDLRYQIIGEKSIFIQDLKFDDKFLSGKLRCIRKDVLPEIMNTVTDITRGIEAKDEEGLVDTTHFVIDYSKKIQKIGIEFNQFGARINDLILYLQTIGVKKGIIEELGFRPIVKNELAKIKDKINRCSEFIVKVHKDNLAQIEAMDKKTFSALQSSIDQFLSDYATISLKFDYRLKPETKTINESIFNIINKLIKNKNNVDLFNTLIVKAENSERNNKIEVFDLLVDKVRSEISVEKVERYRTLVAADMFEKIKIEMHKKNIR